jgi:XTP/dITP diphosphohydrolase
VPETGLTFVENALIKARNASEQSDLPALADDSGLNVASLDGDPGIYSVSKIQNVYHFQTL